MRKACAKTVPKKLATEQKANRRDVCLDLLVRLEREPGFFSHVITGDKSWILEYDLDTNRRRREWHTADTPRHKKARMGKSKIKSMFICFFFLTVRGSSTGNLCHQDKLVIKIFIGKSLKKTQGKARVRPVITDSVTITHKMTTIHARQLQQNTQDNYNNKHKTTTTINTRQLQQYTIQLQQYTQDNYNNTHKTTTTINTRQLQQYTQDN